MAHNIEPMDIDNIEGDFDNKENTYHHSNVLPRTPCTEKGYEELDVSELNMKLRYSITPASSPMSKSYTAHCLDNRSVDCPENIVNSIDNANLTRSLNSTLIKNENLSKSLKLQPLQLHATDPSLDNNRNTSVLRPLDTTVTEDGNNITVTVTEANDIDENLSLPSSSSSALHTPEATTPTKEIPKHDGGSPIMRGLKSVLNMFRASQSPIPSAESEDNVVKHDISSPVEIVSNAPSDMSQVALASTPIAARKQKEPSSKRGSPLKDSIVFNEDLEKELLWKDETTILFSEEKIPIHKLFFQQSKNVPTISKESGALTTVPGPEDSLNDTVEFMDVSYNDSVVKNKTISDLTDVPPSANVAESDSEFVDCETTFTQHSDDEQHPETDKEKISSAIDLSESSVNKTAQELQLTATEERNKSLVDVTNAEKMPQVVTQDLPELSHRNMENPTHTTMSVDNMSLNVTQGIETNIINNNVIEPLESTVTRKSEDKPFTSTFMNITQDYKTEIPNDLTPILDATVADKDSSLSASVMNNAIQSIEVTSSIDVTSPADKTVSIEPVDKPMSVSSFIMNTTQNVTQFATEQLNTTAVIEDKPVSASTFIMNATQNIESQLGVENVNDQLIVTNTIEEKPVFSSTFIMNSTENESQSSTENKNEHLNVTTKIGDEPVLSSTFIMNETQNIGTPPAVGDINDQLNVTKNIEDKLALPFTFVNDNNIAEEQSKSENENEHLNTTLIRSKELVTAEINNVTQIKESELSKHLDATVTICSDDNLVSSSSFIMSSTQNADTLGTSKNNEIIDSTVTLDTKDIASSALIKDDTQSIESLMPGEYVKTPLDSTVSIDFENKQVSTSFISDICQNLEKESLDVPVTTEPISSTTFTPDMTQHIESQATVSNNVQNLNTTAVTEVASQHVTPPDSENIEIYPTSEGLDVTMSADRSMTSFVDFKDVTHQIIDPEIVNNCINALDVTLNTEVTEQPTKTVENTFVSENSLSCDTLNSLDSVVTMKATEVSTTEINNKTVSDNIKDPMRVKLNLKSSAPVNVSEDFVEQSDKLDSAQVIPKEIVEAQQVDSIVCNPVNPDLLNSSGDFAKVPIDITEGKVDDVNKTFDVHEEKGCGENIPADIPLPDEDDLEIESLKTVQESDINNAANSGVLPDVINDLDSSKIQDTNQIDEVPINKIEHLKAPADLITDTLANKETVMDKEEMKNDNASNENNDISFKDKLNEKNDYVNKLPTNTSAEDILLKNVEKEILNLNPVELQVPIANVNELRELTENEITVTKSEDQLESMDISYNAHDISTQKESEIAPKTITTVVASEITFDQNMTKFNEEKREISVQCESPCSGPKIGSVAVVTAAETLSDVILLQNMSVDDMKVDVPDTSVVVEEKNTIKSLLTVPNTESNIVAKKEVIHEEIIDSENNSPYVLVSVDKETANKFDSSLEEEFEKIENPFDSKSKISPSPPASPPIASKGYNFNFDEIDDPFATKTKIRASPPFDSPKQTPKPEKLAAKKEAPKREPVNKNKRKSFPVKPKPVTTKKNFNSTFDSSLPTQNDAVKEKSQFVTNDKIEINSKNTQNIIVEDAKVFNSSIEESELNVVEKSELENNTDNKSKVIDNIETENETTNFDNKSPITSTTPSSSDQSVYLSAATSSGDSITAKNVFNLPEIDDMNFNPFATKSKVRLSPPPSLEVSDTNTSQSKSDTTVNPNVSQNKSAHDEKDCSNASIITCISKDDKNTTVREVHTDSEDTIEGPFLEAEGNEIEGLGLPNNNKDNDFAELGLQNDMMQFSDLPAQDNEDNELFIDAAAYEFLLNQNKSNVVVDSGKESLFLKFDPLFAKRLSSEGIAAALNKIQKRQSTPKKMAKPPQITNAEQAVPGPSTSKVSPQQLNTSEDIAEELNITTSKPMMVVTPAVNPIVTPRKPTTPISSNRRSITFTSPAIAVIDRLLSMSANNSLIDQNTTITQVSREQNEADMALVQLRELLAEKEISVYNLRSESKELKDRLTTLESQMQALESESEQRLKKVNDLTEKLTEKTKINKSMAAVVEEYERTIASLIAETEQDRKRHAEERERLIKERDEQTAHLASMEVSFSDLHSKYEKSKQIILTCKSNEDTYKKSIKDFEDNLTKMQNNYELLKQHATSKLNHANQELEKMNRAHESEVLKLNAMIKRKELHITSLEETLAQKTKANEELTAICDELINKVG